MRLVVRYHLCLAAVTAVLLAGAGLDGAQSSHAQGAALPNWGVKVSVRIKNVQLKQLLEDRAGRIVGVGTFDNKQPRGSHATVVRLRPDGGLDTTFGKGGFANAPYRRYIGWTGGAILSDGRIALVGTDRFGYAIGDGHVVLGMLDPDGGWDTAFGEGGYLTLGSSDCVHSAPGIVADTDRFVVVLLRACGLKDTHTLVLARFSSTGAAADDFGVGGRVQLGDIPWQVSPTAPVIRLPDGAFVVASLEGKMASLRLTRIKADGSRDAGFRRPPATVGAGPVGLQLTGLFPASLGRLTVSGCSQAGPFLARFNRDGSAYRFWGGPAIGRTNVENFGGAFGTPCASFAQLRTYKLAAAGTALVRLFSAGTLDPFEPIAPLPGFRGRTGGPDHVLLALSGGPVLVTSKMERDTVIGRYR